MSRKKCNRPTVYTNMVLGILVIVGHHYCCTCSSPDEDSGIAGGRGEVGREGGGGGVGTAVSLQHQQSWQQLNKYLKTQTHTTMVLV